jgi:hypothetical protein
MKPSKTTSTSKLGTTWRNRITGYGDVDPKSLLANPKNWRIHPESQQAALAAVLDQVGWVQVAAVLNQRTGFVVDGHLRIALAITRDEPTIPVGYVDLSDAEEDLILASLDSIGGAAVTDAAKLSALLSGLELADPALDALFGDLMAEGEKIALTNVADKPESEPGDSNRNLGDTNVQIKPVLYAKDIAVFERALRQTSEHNRGKALIMVCQHYLDHAIVSPLL